MIDRLIDRIKKLFDKKEGVFEDDKIKEEKVPEKKKSEELETYEKRDIDCLDSENILEKTEILIKNSARELFELMEFKEHSLKLWKISEQTSRPLLVMIMGEFKTGKSTFINAILGDEILKSDVTPATAVVSMISYGEEKKIIAHFKDGAKKEYPFEELSGLTAEGDEEKYELRNNLKYVELFIPNEILKEITIIDTPGLNVNNEHHIKATKEFMDEADLVLWVFAHGKAASRTEVAEISELSERLKPIAIVNRIDEIDDEEETLEEVLSGVKRRLKGSVSDIVGVSSEFAKRGIIDGDGDKLKESNWSEFLKLLEDKILQQTENLKRTAIVGKLIDYKEDFKSTLKDFEAELEELGKKFENTVNYKNGLIDDSEFLNAVLEDSIYLRRHKEQITVDAKYMYSCWEDDIEEELNKIELPLIFILRLVEILDIMKNRDEEIDNINSYKDRYDDIINSLKKIKMRNTQILEEMQNHDLAIKRYNSDLQDYHTSGFFGGTPIFDLNGRGASLEKREEELKSRSESLSKQCESCEVDRMSEFLRMTRMNSEIYEYLLKIERILEFEIKKIDHDIEGFEENLRSDMEREERLSREIVEARNVLENLEAAEAF